MLGQSLRAKLWRIVTAGKLITDHKTAGSPRAECSACNWVGTRTEGGRASTIFRHCEAIEHAILKHADVLLRTDGAFRSLGLDYTETQKVQTWLVERARIRDGRALADANAAARIIDHRAYAGVGAPEIEP